jgi:hypothetical protein
MRACIDVLAGTVAPVLNFAIILFISCSIIVLPRETVAKDVNAEAIRNEFARVAKNIHSVSMRMSLRDPLQHATGVRELEICSGNLLRHELSHHLGQNSTDDPFRKINYISNGSLITFLPFSRSFKTTPFPNNSVLPIEAYGSYMVVSGLWPFSWPAPTWNGEPITLAGISADTTRDLRVDSNPIIFNGRQCYRVVYGRFQEFLVDSRLRTIRRTFTAERNGGLSKTFDVLEHVLVDGDIWLPKQYTISLSDSLHPSLSGSERGVTTVEQIEVNRSIESNFVFSFPPGSLDLDSVPPKQVTNGGMSVMHGMSEWLKASRARGISIFVLLRWVLIISVIAICDFGIRAFWPQRR